jgi:hypothetical protein
MYLHGSFALGSADEWSDVDFLCVVERDPDEREQAALQAVHDHGSATPAWDTHCNQALVRWLLRKHGIALAGPPPAELVDAVEPQELRAEARTALEEYVRWAHEPTPQAPAGMNWWKQAYVVLTLCRILWTLRHGTVVPKTEAAAWRHASSPNGPT